MPAVLRVLDVESRLLTGEKSTDFVVIGFETGFIRIIFDWKIEFQSTKALSMISHNGER